MQWKIRGSSYLVYNYYSSKKSGAAVFTLCFVGGEAVNPPVKKESVLNKHFYFKPVWVPVVLLNKHCFTDLHFVHRTGLISLTCFIISRSANKGWFCK